MHKINWEYTIPKLRNTLIAIIIILGITMIAFHWTTTDFVFRIMLGLVCVCLAIGFYCIVLLCSILILKGMFGSWVIIPFYNYISFIYGYFILCFLSNHIIYY